MFCHFIATWITDLCLITIWKNNAHNTIYCQGAPGVTGLPGLQGQPGTRVIFL